MIFFLAVLIGGLFAWSAVQIGFYGTWIMFFNLLLSACMALFLAPVVIESIPEAKGIGYGEALVLLSIAVATLCISYGICYACLKGNLRADFPRVFDNTLAGLLGFLAGFLVCSFLAFAVATTPLAEQDLAKTLHLDAESQRTSTSTNYLCLCCDWLHGFVGRSDAGLVNSHAAVNWFLEKRGPRPQVAPPTPVTPPVGPSVGPTGEAAPARITDSQEPADATKGQGGGPSAAKPGQPAGADGVPPSKSRPWGDDLAPKPKPNVVPDNSARPESKPPRDAPPDDKPDTRARRPPASRGDKLYTSARRPPAASENKPAASNSRPPPSGARPSVGRTQPIAPAGPQGPLAGAWTAWGGAQFRIDDDGKTISISLLSSNVLQVLNGKLARQGAKPNSKLLSGTFETVFAVDAPKRRMINVTATIIDANRISLRCSNWPVFDNRGKYMGSRPIPLPEILTRLDDSSGDRPAPPDPFETPANPTPSDNPLKTPRPE